MRIISEIIVAVLALVGTLVGTILSSRKTTALLDYRLQKLESEVAKHNQIIERTYKLEESVALLDAEDHRHNERIKALEARI